MKHPFEKIFDDALRKSTGEDNRLTRALEELLEKGYQEDEVFRALTHFSKGLIDANEERIVADTMHTLERGHAD